jgi:hypothetical protein
MRQVLIILLIFKFGFAFGQDFAYPIVKKQGQTISDFIPNGWILRDSAIGDLNNDLNEDAALVFQFKDSITLINNEHGSSDTVITQPRILALLFWDNSTNGFLLKEQNNKFILNHDNPNMDDPFEGIEIEKGILIINFRIWYSWGSWWTSNDSYKFRFQNSDFALIGFESNSFHRASGDSKSYSINFLTKKYSITSGENTDDNYKSKTEWKTFKLPVLKTIRTLSKPYFWAFNNEIAI